MIECGEAEEIDDGDILEVDMERGVIKNLTKNTECKVKPLPMELQEILRSGGLVNYVKKHGKLPWQ
ncbi:hypothetical protein DRO55_00130 [Candidatus Bathyarchaeota archaeon]|nr:MAG: hypothetical protein DRO55_00130 [Candidatus Bathyarchaeota archaeon]